MKIGLYLPKVFLTRAKQAQACNTAPCLRIKS